MTLDARGSRDVAGACGLVRVGLKNQRPNVPPYGASLDEMGHDLAPRCFTTRTQRLGRITRPPRLALGRHFHRDRRLLFLKAGHQGTSRTPKSRR
jgi:hypothetical protein